MISYYQDRMVSLTRIRKQFGGVRHNGRIATYICIGRNPDLCVRDKNCLWQQPLCSKYGMSRIFLFITKLMSIG